ncbi:MAG TPA: hypothetical protein DER05_08450 [Lutibacter sp.]|nr:hypothetical protein [Lutibacter sp.]
MQIKIISMKKSIAILAFLLAGTIFISAQNVPCKVLKVGIEKEYSGKCKKGLANGKGIAKGRFFYDGDFKKGLPNGKGILKFSQNEYYVGEWKDGLQDGKGELHYKVNGVDSIKVGIWEKGNYLGKKAISPYLIKYTSGVDRYSLSKSSEGDGGKFNRVIIKFIQNGGVNTSVSNFMLQGDSGNRTNINNVEGFENITFPFLCKITYSTLNKFRTSTHTAIFEFVINKPGDWELILNN